MPMHTPRHSDTNSTTQFHYRTLWMRYTYSVPCLHRIHLYHMHTRVRIQRHHTMYYCMHIQLDIFHHTTPQWPCVPSNTSSAHSRPDHNCTLDHSNNHTVELVYLRALPVHTLD